METKLLQGQVMQNVHLRDIWLTLHLMLHCEQENLKGSFYLKTV